MTSFLLRECIAWAREQHSVLYVCFLDVQKAFDRTWHNGLLYKLYEMGIKGRLWRVIANMHSDMESSVQYKGHKSSIFSVHQGSRQGGVISPFTYLCYTDRLLLNRVNCNAGLKICDIPVSCPTVADDMVLVSLSKMVWTK